MGVAVQFVGLKQVMAAFNKKGTVNWSLWSGKEMITAYEGTDATESESELEDWLKMFRNNTTAQYVLKFYAKGTKQIKPSTEHSSVINFRLYEEEDRVGGGSNSIGSVVGAVETMMSKMMDRFEANQKQVMELMKKEPDDERLQTWERMLDHPVVMAGLGKMFGLDMNGLLAQAEKISGVPGSQPAAGTDELDEIIDKLMGHDPQFLQHMQKLLLIAERKPAQLKFLLGMLDSMQV